MTAGYCADSLIENFFRNTKGTKSSRWCSLENVHVDSNTRMQFRIKKSDASRNTWQTFYFRGRSNGWCVKWVTKTHQCEQVHGRWTSKSRKVQAIYLPTMDCSGECTLHGVSSSHHCIRLVLCISVHLWGNWMRMWSSFMNMFLLVPILTWKKTWLAYILLIWQDSIGKTTQLTSSQDALALSIAI